MVGGRNNAAVLGAVVAVLAITAAVVLMAKDNSSTVAFLGVASPTIVALLTLMKTEAVQNAVTEVKANVDELTNGKMTAAVQNAVESAIGPVVEQIEHATTEMQALDPKGKKR